MGHGYPRTVGETFADVATWRRALSYGLLCVSVVVVIAIASGRYWLWAALAWAVTFSVAIMIRELRIARRGTYNARGPQR
jgi:hypothetical protein